MRLGSDRRFEIKRRVKTVRVRIVDREGGARNDATLQMKETKQGKWNNKKKRKVVREKKRKTKRNKIWSILLGPCGGRAGEQTGHKSKVHQRAPKRGDGRTDDEDSDDAEDGEDVLRPRADREQCRAIARNAAKRQG